MAILYKVTGEESELTVKADGVDSLIVLQDAVGGNIETLSLPNGKILILNEEGKIHNLPENLKATELVKDILSPVDYIAGDAVLCSQDELD